MILYAIRHDRTVPPPGRPGPAGRLDVPLVGTHEAAAAAVLAALERCAAPSERPSHVWTSPLSRCALTARLVSRSLDVPLIEDPRLLELDYGAWEGRAWDDLPRAASDAWMQNWEHEGPPGGGESALALAGRVAAWLDDPPRHLPGASLTASHLPGVHLLVGHAGVIRALRTLLPPRISWPDAMATPVPFASDPDAMTVFRA
jgi:alpha-ribazole phosphatase